MTKKSLHTAAADQRLAQLLKGQSQPLEPTDRWFTPRVLNRLPERRSARYPMLAIVFYALAVLGCALSWVWLMSGSWSVITVRDCLNALAVMTVTALIVISPFATLLRQE